MAAILIAQVSVALTRSRFTRSGKSIGRYFLMLIDPRSRSYRDSFAKKGEKKKGKKKNIMRPNTAPRGTASAPFSRCSRSSNIKP